jgi:hypothetical protein
MKKIFITFLILVTLASVLFSPNTSLAAYEVRPDAPDTAKATYAEYLKAHNNIKPASIVEYTNWLGARDPNQPTWTDWLVDKTVPQSTIAAGRAIEDAVSNSACGVTSFFTWECVQEIIFRFIAFIGNMILSLVSWILWMTGILFNLSIITMVINMKSFIDKIPAIFVIWQTMRDFVNMFFIFILLVIAIQTILDTGYNYKKILIQLVIVALFINFSFFGTGVLIDFSNTLALMFYNGFSNGECKDKALLGSLEGLDGCMSWRIVQSLKLTTLYVAPQVSVNGNDSSTNVGTTSALAGVAVNNLTLQYKFILTVILGSILMIVTSGIFLASGILIFFRFIVLIILLMFSPLAFFCRILPATQKYWSMWWSKLTEQLIFAPVYFMFLWVVMIIITSKNKEGVGLLQGALRVGDSSGFAAAMQNNVMDMFGLIANYIIVIFLLGFALILAKQLGAQGSDVATKAAKGFQGMVGRNTVGRVSSRIANSQAMQDLVKKNPFAGRLVQKTFDAGASASFGGKKGGFEQVEKDMIKDREAQAKRMGPSVLMTENAKKERDAANNNLDAQRKAIEGTSEVGDIDKEIEATKDRIEHFTDQETDPKKSAAQQKTGKAARELNESTLRDLQTKRKAMIDAALKPHVDRAEQARSEADRIMGVDNEEATKRARTKLGENATKEQVAEEAKKLLVKGIAKTRQEEYTNTLSHDYSKGRLGKMLGGAVNLVTNRTSHVAASAAITKNVIKGKTKAEQLLEEIDKKNKDEAKKTEDDAKPKDDKPKTT